MKFLSLFLLAGLAFASLAEAQTVFYRVALQVYNENQELNEEKVRKAGWLDAEAAKKAGWKDAEEDYYYFQGSAEVKSLPFSKCLTEEACFRINKKGLVTLGYSDSDNHSGIEMQLPNRKGRLYVQRPILLKTSGEGGHWSVNGIAEVSVPPPPKKK